MTRSFFPLAAAAGLLCAALASGEDWPEFRGPTGQGLVRVGRLPLEWGPAKNVVWKQSIPGNGWSSPVVVDGRIYLTAGVPLNGNAAGDLSLQALCLDAGTGKILWEREVFRQEGSNAPPIHSKNSHASPTPLVFEQRLYIHFGHQGTACLDLSGKVLWRSNSLKYNPVHGNGGSPILVEDALIFSCDGGDVAYVAALDRQTGQVLWKTDRSVDNERKFSFSTLLLITVDGRKQVISPGSGMVGAYDPGTGREIWRVRYDGYSVIPRPVYGHGLVYICTGYNTPSLLAIRPDGAGDVTDSHVAWTTRRAVPHTPSLLLDGDELYMVSDSGVASCLDARSGKVHWGQRLGGAYSASPVLADGKVYFQSEQGLGVVVKTGRKYELLAKNRLDERTLASYAVAGSALFLRTGTHLYRFEER
jgi:outer membrane protein assembly factor BamB